MSAEADRCTARLAAASLEAGWAQNAITRLLGQARVAPEDIADAIINLDRALRSAKQARNAAEDAKRAKPEPAPRADALIEWNRRQREERKALKIEAARLGCELDGDEFEGQLVAPKGHTLDGDLHAFVATSLASPWLADWADVRERLRGCACPKCETPSCEWCNGDET